jgi:membrane dipeptidase
MAPQVLYSCFYYTEEQAPMIVVDAHEDIAFNALSYGRDYRRSALKTRELEAGMLRPGATLGLPESIAGRVALVFSTIFVEPQNSSLLSGEVHLPTYSTAAEAYALGMKQLDYYHRLADESPRISLVQTKADLNSVLATWEEGKSIVDRRQGLVVLMEGADPILEPKQFEEWYERGVRIVGLAWEETRYSAGTGKPGRISPLGRELLEAMASFNAILDLSHMAEEAFLEAVDLYDGILIASHSNPRKFRNTDRHLSDDMIRKLAERNGVMGVVLYNRFLSDKWERTDPKHTIRLSIVADAIDHICQITGSAAHVGIGSDFDGGFGVEQIPYEIDTVGDLLKIGDVLRERGYSAEDIEAVLSGNMLRKLKEALG